MKEVGVLEAKTHLSALLDDVEKGEEVLITRHGKPVAQLIALPGARRPTKEAVERILALREAIARECPSTEPFDWKAAVEEGRE
jgi:prevent-host-death family protein